METTPGVKAPVSEAARRRLATQQKPPLAMGLLGQRPKREQSQVTVKAPAAKF
jgi:hypothetical protein